MTDFNNPIVKAEVSKLLASEPLLGYIKSLREDIILAQAYSKVDLSGKTPAEMQLTALVELKGQLVLLDDLLELALLSSKNVSNSTTEGV